MNLFLVYGIFFFTVCIVSASKQLKCGKPPLSFKTVEMTISNKKRKSMYSEGTEVTYDCPVNYRLVGVKRRRCRSGQWRPKDGKTSCKLAGCAMFPKVSNSVAVSETTKPPFSFGSVVNYTCNKHYKLKGLSTMTCRKSGKWLQQGIKKPSCISTGCGHPPDPPYPIGRVTLPHDGDVFPVGTIVNYTCPEGYHLHGIPFRICTKNKEWKPDTSFHECRPGVPTCSFLWYLEDLLQLLDLGSELRDDSTVMTQVLSFAHEQEAYHSCHEGFDLVGSPVRTCVAVSDNTTSWTGVSPTCKDRFKKTDDLAAQLRETFIDRNLKCEPQNSSDENNTVTTGSSTFCHGRTVVVGDGCVDLIYALDCSGSITKEGFDVSKEFVIKSVRLFRVENGKERVALVTYDDHVHPQFEFGDELNPKFRCCCCCCCNRNPKFNCSDLNPKFNCSDLNSKFNCSNLNPKFNCSDLNPKFSCSDLSTTAGTLNRIRKTPFCGGATSATRLLVYINETIISKSKIGCKIAIFIISDGRNNWGGNPDKIASSLKKIENLEIFTVAFGTNKLGWESLKKLSSGEEHFIPVRNAEDVTKAVDKAIEVPNDYGGICGLAVSKYNACRDALSDHCRSAPGAWPWLVGLYIIENARSQPEIVCGAALVGDCWILTAAHCVYGRSVLHRLVVTGNSDRHINEGTETTYEISKILIHPKYNPQTLEYDVALLHLSCNVSYSPFVKKICLPDCTTDHYMYRPGTQCTVAGWGATDLDSDSSTFRLSTHLRHFQLPIADLQRCQNSSTFAIKDSFICAGDATGQKGACKGDSGGPIFCERKDGAGWVVVGVVSWGEGCKEAYKYDIFTNLCHKEIRTWIEEQMSLYDCYSCPDGQETCSCPDTEIVIY